LSQAGTINVSGGGSGTVNGIFGDDGEANVVIPNGLGHIELLGNIVAAATHAKPVFFEKNASTIEELDVQVASAQIASNINNAGLASFNSTQFSVDANGFVTVVATPPPFVPNQIIQDFDDFLSISSNSSGKLNWFFGSPWEQANGTSTNPGLFQIEANTPVGTFFGLSNPDSFGTDVYPWVLGGGALSCSWVLNLVTLGNVTDNYTVYIGISDSNGSGVIFTPNNGCYFQYNYNVNGGKYQIVCNSSGITTVTDSGVLANTNFTNFTINVNAAATSVTFLINGVQVGSPIATNIPLVPIGPNITFSYISGFLPRALLDLFYYTQTLTVAR